jgi:hypothetical protein
MRRPQVSQAVVYKTEDGSCFDCPKAAAAYVSDLEFVTRFGEIAPKELADWLTQEGSIEKVMGLLDERKQLEQETLVALGVEA